MSRALSVRIRVGVEPILLLAGLFVACESHVEGEGAPATRDTARAAAIFDAPGAVRPGDWACDVLSGLPGSWSVLIEGHRNLDTAFDDCVLAILDSVADRMVNDQDDRYWALADSISCHVDGVFADAMNSSVWLRVFTENGLGLVRYLHRHQTDHGSCIEAEFVHGIGFELQAETFITRSRFDTLAARISDDRRLTGHEKQYADRLWREIRSVVTLRSDSP